jgi:hypothetical protein
MKRVRRRAREEEMERGQAWSMDLIFGVLIFMLAIGVIYAMLTYKAKENTEPLRIESEVISQRLTANQTTDALFPIAPHNTLDEDKLGKLTDLDYEELRQRLGVQREFCIYLHDEQGNLIYIQDSLGNRYTGIGSATGELNLSGKECGKPLP